MNIEELRDYCLAKPGSFECFPFNEETLVFKVISKMFAIIPLEHGDRIVLKCDPERSSELREEWEEIIPWNYSKKHWNTLFVNDRLPPKLVLELVDHSYELVKKGLKKSERAELEE